MECRLLVNQPACTQSFARLFECTERSTFSCDAQGEATAPGCVVEAAIAGLCFLGNAADPQLKAPCERYCTDAEAAACPSADAHSDCVYGCQAAGPLAPSCAEPWSTFLACSVGAAFYCGDEGKPVPGGCESEYLRYAACVIDASQ